MIVAADKEPLDNKSGPIKLLLIEGKGFEAA